MATLVKTEIEKTMREAPVVLINHLLEPPARITGITRYLFTLLEELVLNNSFKYALVSTWGQSELPHALRSSIACFTRRFISSAPLNVMTQMAIIPGLMRETRAVLEFNCNPIGCFWPFWPRIITVHDLYYESMPDSFPRRRRIGWRLLFPRSVNAASAIICVSEASRQKLTTLYPRSIGKALVIHEAGALRGLEGGTCTETEPYGLYVGNISPNKNPAVLAQALKILENKGNPVNFYHAGRDELALLADAQRHNGLAHPIRSMGTVTDSALAASYRNAHCLVNTSLDEGFCLPILEAQSRGVPIICSDIPVLREVAGEGALFFDPTSPVALAEIIFKMFTDSSLRTDMANRARENAALFSWKQAAVETETIFRNVLEQKRPNTERAW
jgi:glycosyltransferase involved in cell wall biosynthesis